MVADVTYGRPAGLALPACVTDVFSRMGSLVDGLPPQTDLSSPQDHAVQLRVAKAPRDPHRDRGGEYSSHSLERELRRHDALASMQRRRLLDNALAEASSPPWASCSTSSSAAARHPARGPPRRLRYLGRSTTHAAALALGQIAPPRSSTAHSHHAPSSDRITVHAHFPSDDAVVKLLWLAIRDIEDKRARERAKERGKPTNQRTAPPHLVEGAITQGWRPAMAALLIAFGDRVEPYLQ